MSDDTAPDRIWAYRWHQYTARHIGGDQVEYVRADRLAELEAERDRLREISAEWESSLAAIGGCGDGGCVVHRPGGMHTNGGCRCSEDRVTARRVMRVDCHYRARLAAALKGDAP